MLAGTSFDVLAEFFPSFSQLDKFDHLAPFADVPTTIVCGTEGQAHLDRPQPQAGPADPRRAPRRVRGRRAHGDLRAARQGQRRPRGAGGGGDGRLVSTEILRVDGSRAADVLAVIHEAFAEPAAARPAGDGPRRDRGDGAPRPRRARRPAGRARRQAGRHAALRPARTAAGPASGRRAVRRTRARRRRADGLPRPRDRRAGGLHRPGDRGARRAARRRCASGATWATPSRTARATGC